MSRSVVIAALSWALLVGCNGSYYAQYSAAHPDWQPSFPARGLDLEESVASLYLRPRSNVRVVVSELEILRTDATPWQRFGVDDLASGRVAPNQEYDYALRVLVSCTALGRSYKYLGQRVSWYLLPRNALEAWDHFGFEDACTSSNDFRPASGALVAVEAELLREQVDPQGGPLLLFHRGLGYAKAGRIDDAQRLLAAGDAALPEGEDPHEAYRIAARESRTLGRQGGALVETARLELIRAIDEAATPAP